MTVTTASKPEIHTDVETYLGPNRNVLMIHGRVYDVKDFVKRHPGGNVILYNKNQEASDVYDAFHLRSKKADRLLKTLPSISLPEYFILRKLSGMHVDTAPAACVQTLTSTTASGKSEHVPTPILKQSQMPAEGSNLDMHLSLDSSLESERTKNILTEFQKFRQELEDEGHFDPSLLHVAYRCFEVVAMFVLHFYLLSIVVGSTEGSYSNIWFGQLLAPEATISWSILLATIMIGGISGGRAGWVQHEGGHGSLTGWLGVDKFIQEVGISFGLITYAGKWNNMHNKHHATPQKEGKDPDLDTLPFLATYEQILFRGRRRNLASKMGWWLKYQHYTFFLLTAVINVFFWHLYLHPREYILRKFRPITLFLVLSRYFVHMYVTIPTSGIIGGLVSFFFTMYISGIYLFGNFSLNHTYLATLEGQYNKNWVDQQMDYTINIVPTIPVNWWMGYLNCQIEHHLFPNMPQFRQPGICKRTKEFCDRVGVPYRTISYFGACKAMVSNLHAIASRVDTYQPYLCAAKKSSAAHICDPKAAKGTPNVPAHHTSHQEKFDEREGLRRRAVDACEGA